MGDANDLIAAIYDAAIDSSRWEDVVRRIVESTKSVSGGLFIEQEGVTQLAATHHVDPYWAKAFVEYWHQHNPLRTVATSVSPGELKSGTHITQTASYKTSAFFNEFVRPQGWADTVGIGLLRGPKSFGHLVVQRSPDAVWIEPKEWALLETLAPHLKRAAGVHQLLSQAKAFSETLSEAVVAAGFSVFVLARDGKVLFANKKAEQLVRYGAEFRTEKGRLMLASLMLTERFNQLVRDAAEPDRSHRAIGGSLEVPWNGNSAPLVAHIFPLDAHQNTSIFEIDRPAAAVFVVDPAVDLAAQIDRFSARFDLTVSEKRVLTEIIGGGGLLAAAAKLKITEATARTHTNRIFAKTGTARQTELIRRFFENIMPATQSA